MSEEAKAGSIHFCIVHLWAFACCFLSLTVKLLFGGNLRKNDRKPFILLFECISPAFSCLTLKASRIRDLPSHLTAHSQSIRPCR